MNRSDVYRGEHLLEAMLEARSLSEDPVLAEVGGSRILLPLERKYGDLDGVRRYLDWVLSLPEVKERYRSTTAPEVRERRGQDRAHYEHRGVIALPLKEGRTLGLRETTVLHELAHHLARGHGHDELWRECYLFLLGTAMGPEVSLALQILWASFASATLAR